MYLLIDASEVDLLKVGLLSEGLISKSLDESGKRATSSLLSMINALTNGDFKKIAGIIVVNRSYSFTAVRIVAAVANALSFLHKLPLYEADGSPWMNPKFKKKRVKLCLPVYSGEPNITI